VVVEVLVVVVLVVGGEVVEVVLDVVVVVVDVVVVAVLDVVVLGAARLRRCLASMVPIPVTMS
jgi:hypothetical protein